jgi:hypothetical protein
MKSYKKGLLALLTLFLSVSISTVGFSSFVINNKLNTTSTIQINKTNKDEKVKISFKYQVCTGYKETEGNEEETGYRDVNIGNWNKDKTEYDKFFKLVNDWCETGFSGDSVEKNSTPYKRKGKGKYSGYNVYIKVSRKIETHKLFSKTYYSGEYTITVKKINVQLAYDFPSTSTSITIDKGSSIPTSFIKNSFYKDSNSKDYEFVGFKEVRSDGKPSDSFISLDKTFITDTTLYAIFNKKTLDGDTKYNLSDTINNTSSGTVDFNAGVAVGKLNLSNDFTWLDSEKKVFLGGANTKTTINKGINVRFLFNDGSESKKNEFNSESVYVEPVEKNRQYTIVLQNDLIINGQMQVEGNYGVNTSGITQGVIAKEYICLDLNGHNITINNGGKLISNGLIIDSVGTGQINVEGGGYLRTLAVIHDYRGGTMTQSYVNNDVFPFQVYQLPYLRCKARVKYDQTNGWGSLNGYVNAQAFRDVVAGDLTILKGQQEFELNFIGPSNSNYFIKLDKPSTYNEDSYVDVIGYKENSIDETSANKLYSISQRIKIIINNCNVSIGEFKFNIKVSGISISVDTSKYSLPISSFFDLEVKNSFLTLDKRIKFLPGSSLIVDNKSTTLLSYDKSAKRAGQISVLDKSYYYYDKNYKYVTTDLIKLADMSGKDNNGNATEANISGDGYGQRVFKDQSFQKYKSNPNVQIKGTLLFKTGNDSGMDYQLSGTINLSKIGYTSDGTLSSSTSSTIVNSDNPFSELNKQSVKVITYGYDYMIGNCSNNSHVKGFSRPLVSNETAYYNDGTKSYVGTYEDDGIFRVNSKTYYFNNDGKYKTNDTTLPTLKECDYDSISKIITDNNQQYIYIASMYCKLTSTDNKTGTVDHTRLSENATVDSKVKYDKTLGKWVKG